MMKCKRILALALCLVTLVSVMSVTAFAANTSDTKFTNFKLNSNEWFYLITPREKTNDSKVYLYYTTGTYNAVRAKVYGKTTYSSTTNNNCTYYDGSVVSYVTCVKGTKYSIGNLVYERDYPWATLGFWSQYTDTISGVWSPDSAGTYTIARP